MASSGSALKFGRLPGHYSIVRLPAGAQVHAWAVKGGFTSITRTADELSIVCPAEHVPQDIERGQPWVCLKLEGPFPFSQTGVLLSFIGPLSSNAIPIFAVSTHDTDYVLVPSEFAEKAVATLRHAGHEPIA